MKQILFTIIYCISMQAMAQNSLHGKVHDVQGNPIIGATISIPDLKIGAVSNIDGAYEINTTATGKHLIECHYIGYQTFLKEINIQGSTLYNIVLSTSVIEQKEVIITGQSKATAIKKSSLPVNVIHTEDLVEQANTNLIQAVAKVAGVSSINTGPAISKPIIRGLGYNRIIVMSNGIRQEGQQWGDEHGIEVDENTAGRIEVLKGPASLLYGSDGIAGVINIQPPSIAVANSISGKINANYQSNNRMINIGGHIAGNQHGFIWNIGATHKQASDYQNKYDGYVFDSRFKENDLYARIGFTKKWGHTHVSISSFNQNLGLVEGDRDSMGNFIKLVKLNDSTSSEELANSADFKSYTNETPHQHIIHTKVVLDNAFNLRHDALLQMILGFQNSRRSEFGDVLKPTQAGLDLDLHTFTYDIKYHFPQLHKWYISLGIGGMQQQNKNTGIEFLIPDYTLFSSGIFLYGKKEISEKLTFNAGARIDFQSLHADEKWINNYNLFKPISENYFGVSASMGLAYAANANHTFRFNLGKGFRNPNIAELSLNGVHEGTLRYEYGNANSTSENNFEADLGYQYDGSHVSITANVFANYIHDFIFIRKLKNAIGNDSIPTENNDNQRSAFYYDKTDAILSGAEFSIDMHPHPLDGLHIENTISYVRGITTFTGDSLHYLPSIPPLRWNVDIRWNFKTIKHKLKDAYAKAEWNIFAAQKNIFSAYQTETASKGYSLLNIGIGSSILYKNHTSCSLHFAINNVLNTAYQNHLSRLKYAPENLSTGRLGVFDMGRNMSVKLLIPFGVK